MTNEGQFTPESAREAGRASAAARRRRAEMSPEERARDTIAGKMDDLTAELVSAALGQGDFSDLKLETRVTALTKLLEWGLGRPTTAKPPKEEGPAVPQTGDELFE